MPSGDRDASVRSAVDDTPTVESLQLEVWRLRDLLIGAEAQIGELTSKLSKMDEHRRLSEQLWQARIANTEHELAVARGHEQLNNEILASTTWRLGRLFVVPLTAIRRFLGVR